MGPGSGFKLGYPVDRHNKAAECPGAGAGSVVGVIANGSIHVESRWREESSVIDAVFK